MKFIFPQNYNFSAKFLGVLDYKTVIFNIIFWIFIFLITKLFNFSLSIRIFIFILTCFPVFLVSLFGFHQENIIYVFKYLFLYFKNPKIYLYKKNR